MGVGCEEGCPPSQTGGGSREGAMPPLQKIFLIFDIKMVGFCAFWWYYFAHVYIWGPITKSKWLVCLEGQNFFHSQRPWGTFTHVPPLPTLLGLKLAR